MGKVVEFKVVFHEETRPGRGLRLRRATLAGRAVWNHRTFLDRARKGASEGDTFSGGILSCVCQSNETRGGKSGKEKKKETLWINELKRLNFTLGVRLVYTLFVRGS